MKKIEMLNEGLKLATMASIIAVAMPELSFAGPANVNELFHTVSDGTLSSLPYILSVVCYVGGAFMLVSGALSLKKHAENPASEPMGKGIARLVTGGAITSVPALTGIIQGSTGVDGANQADFTNFAVTF